MSVFRYLVRPCVLSGFVLDVFRDVFMSLFSPPFPYIVLSLFIYFVIYLCRSLFIYYVR